MGTEGPPSPFILIVANGQADDRDFQLTQRIIPVNGKSPNENWLLILSLWECELILLLGTETISHEVYEVQTNVCN